MNWLDLGLIIFILIFIIIGLKRGFMTSVISNFSFGTNVLLSFFLYSPISKLYNRWFHLGDTIANNFSTSLINSSGNFATNLLEISKDNLSSFVSETLNLGSIPKIPKLFFNWFLNNSSLYDKLHSTDATSRTLADIVSNSYSTFFVTIISFITSLVLIYLIILLIRLLIKKLREIGLVKAVDTILGSFYGLFRVFIILVIVCIVMSLMSPLPFMSTVTNYINQSLFGKVIYSQVNLFIDKYLNYNDLINLIFKK